jgi:hypothetical protein
MKLILNLIALAVAMLTPSAANAQSISKEVVLGNLDSLSRRLDNCRIHFSNFQISRYLVPGKPGLAGDLRLSDRYVLWLKGREWQVAHKRYSQKADAFDGADPFSTVPYSTSSLPTPGTTIMCSNGSDIRDFLVDPKTKSEKFGWKGLQITRTLPDDDKLCGWYLPLLSNFAIRSESMPLRTRESGFDFWMAKSRKKDWEHSVEDSDDFLVIPEHDWVIKPISGSSENLELRTILRVEISRNPPRVPISCRRKVQYRYQGKTYFARSRQGLDGEEFDSSELTNFGNGFLFPKSGVISGMAHSPDSKPGVYDGQEIVRQLLAEGVFTHTEDYVEVSRQEWLVHSIDPIPPDIETWFEAPNGTRHTIINGSEKSSLIIGLSEEESRKTLEGFYHGAAKGWLRWNLYSVMSIVAVVAINGLLLGWLVRKWLRRGKFPGELRR